MINFLRRVFIKNYDDVKNQGVRTAHGIMAAVVGVISNVVLFIIKGVAGILSNSISILADSINNLSDMASSVVTLVGFKMASQPADKDHPYGHQRIEYLAGLIVAIVIMFVGGMLLYSSVDKIIHYEAEDVSNVVMYVSIGILVLSIGMKLVQSVFNRRVGKLIDSVALEATACDSRNDVIATSVVLVGTIVRLIWPNIPFSIDGVLGILVSLFILYSGFNLIKEASDPLIGQSVSRDYVIELVEYIKSFDVCLGVHDVVCHMYGPTKCFMTIHVEVDAEKSLFETHDRIDEIEHLVRKKYGVELTIHMDPLEIHDEETNRVKGIVKDALLELDSKLRFHDFRIVRKMSRSTILFDIELPYDYRMSKEEIISFLESRVNSGDEKFVFLVDFDNIYVGD